MNAMTEPRAATYPHAPVGVIDSGMGGLSVLREIRGLLPAEALCYVADSGFVPYGSRPATEIRRRAESLVRFLLAQQVKAVVVACNTATAAAARSLRERWPGLPIVAMEPAVKPAVAATRSGVVGVLATEGTLGSARFAGLLEQYAGRVEVITQPCPGLVEAVEQGDLDGPVVGRLLERYLTPLIDAGADTIILGCTHYPFLRERIREMAGDRLQLIDTGAAVARQLRRRLDEAGLQASVNASPMHRFWTTGDPGAMHRFLARHWPEPEAEVGVVDSDSRRAPG